MAFEVHDYLDLVRLLGEHPEWRVELRRLLLTDDLLALPQMVRELTEAQRRTEEQVAALAQAQRRTEERLSRIEEEIKALAEAQRRTEEAQRRTEEQLAALAEAQRRTEERLNQLAADTGSSFAQIQEIQQQTEMRLGFLIGRALEGEYKNKASAYFGPLLRRVRVIERETLRDTLEASLSPADVIDVLLTDLIICGGPRVLPEVSDVYLAVEVSAVVDENDVKRA